MLFLQKINEALTLDYKTKRYWNSLSILIVISFLFFTSGTFAQFYRGSSQEFGKNRLQFELKNWQHFDFREFNVYFYGAGRDLAIYSSKSAQETLKEYEKTFDYRISNKIYIIVFNNQRHYRESNIGLKEGSEGNIGGVTHIQGKQTLSLF